MPSDEACFWIQRMPRLVGAVDILFDETLCFTLASAELPVCRYASEVAVQFVDDEAADDDDEAQAPRNRAPLHPRYQTRIACIECHRNKLGCDCDRPCARCLKAGKAELCTDRVHTRHRQGRSRYGKYRARAEK